MTDNGSNNVELDAAVLAEHHEALKQIAGRSLLALEGTLQLVDNLRLEHEPTNKRLAILHHTGVQYVLSDMAALAEILKAEGDVTEDEAQAATAEVEKVKAVLRDILRDLRGNE